MLLNAAEDRATLRSDLSADRGNFKAESDAASVALFFCAKNITLCGKLQSDKPRGSGQSPICTNLICLPFVKVVSFCVFRLEDLKSGYL